MEYIVYLITLFCIFCSAGLGVAILGLLGRQPILSSGLLIGTGAYLVTALSGVNFLPLASLTAAFAIISGLSFVLMMQRLQEDLAVLCTLIIQLIFVGVFLNLGSITGGVNGAFLALDPWHPNLVMVLAILLFGFATFVFHSLQRGKVSILVRGSVGNPALSQAMGRNPWVTSILLSAIASLVLLLCGATHALLLNYVHPTSYNDALSLALLAVILLAKTPSIYTICLASLTIFGLPELLRFVDLPPEKVGHLREIFFGTAVVLIIFFGARSDYIRGLSR